MYSWELPTKTQKNETIKFRDSSYPLSTGTYCNNSYFTASKSDLKPFRDTRIPIYVNYRDGSSVAKDSQYICGFCKH
uniref:Uncharacterized protein n=1 Tax=Amphimedon queenslandica TaxID=400682 RepID=A0A1X7SU04_AMPQE